MGDTGKVLAKTALDIGAIKLWPKHEPFLWASGFHMPIYNDNRMLLGDYKHRMLVTKGFKDIIEEQSLQPDLIAGTSTAGIAPAASLAQHLNLPLVIQHEGEVFLFAQNVIQDVRDIPIAYDDVNIIVSTCPFSIPPGVEKANDSALPFAYVRSKQKDHGMKQSIEGIVSPGQRAALIDVFREDSYRDSAIQTLIDAGLSVPFSYSNNFRAGILKPYDVSGKKILQIEDLLSTGGSVVEEITDFQERGAEVIACASIFNYELEVMKKKMAKTGVPLYSGLTYSILLEQAIESGSITEDNRRDLAEWRDAPFEWGANHNHPPVKKN